MSTKSDRWPVIDRAVFHVITSADWARQLRHARSLKNPISEEIRRRLRAMDNAR